jgi:hypothetical protein
VLPSLIVGFLGMLCAAPVEFSRWRVDGLAAARAGMRMGHTLDPELIAQPILDALGGKATVLPGNLSKLLEYGLVPLPRWAQ